MQKARSAGKKVLEEDQVHPNYEGHRLMAAIVLRALGHPKVPLPRHMRVGVMPGILRNWKIRPTGEKEMPLDEKTVRTLKPDGGWKGLHLPDKTSQSNWWLDQERKRGFAVGLDKKFGRAKSYLGIASLEAKRAHPVFFNTGAQLQTIWLNGKRIYHNQGWTGWHAGKERIKALLKPGPNIIVIETGSDFFLSITPDNRW